MMRPGAAESAERRAAGGVTAGRRVAGRRMADASRVRRRMAGRMVRHMAGRRDMRRRDRRHGRRSGVRARPVRAAVGTIAPAVATAAAPVRVVRRMLRAGGRTRRGWLSGLRWNWLSVRCPQRFARSRRLDMSLSAAAERRHQRRQQRQRNFGATLHGLSQMSGGRVTASKRRRSG